MGEAMSATDDKHLWVSWDEYHRKIEDLALLVHASGWRFDLILCLARGGVRVGDVMSRIFDVPLGILSTSSYRQESGTIRSALDIAKHITIANGALTGHVLLVDDLVDSGVTLEKVQHHLREHFPAITAVKSAVIWCKGCSSMRPEYYVDFLPLNPWIHQPFEEYDSMRPAQLVAKRKAADSTDSGEATPA